MTIRYPFVVATMINPLDGECPRDQDFNRIYTELNAIEATLGVNVHGTATNLASRLNQTMQPNPAGGEGWPKNGVVCEDDPAGGKRGTRRWYVQNIEDTVVWGTGSEAGEKSIGFPYNIFDAPPIVCFSIGIQTSAQALPLATSMLQTVSKHLVRFKAYNNTGAPTSQVCKIVYLALGQLEVFDDATGPFMWREERLG